MTMNLHEYQAKSLLKKYDLPVPSGYVCHSVKEIEKLIELNKIVFDELGWVMKCQIHAGGRGCAGGVVFVNNKKTIFDFANKWFGRYLSTYQTTARGLPVHAMLVEKRVDIEREFYLGAIVDRCSKSILIMASVEGGINIEIAAAIQKDIHKTRLNPLLGLQPQQCMELVNKLELTEREIEQFTTILRQFITLFLENDVFLAEINPLVITKGGDFLCLDAKMVIDHNALYRQPELVLLRDISQENRQEYLASRGGFSYVSLDGNIGCLANGAGLAMATMDTISSYGGRPANFLDIGGSTTKKRVTEAIKLILLNKRVKVILVNIFAGITRCDFVADGIVAAAEETGSWIPIVVRLEGNGANFAKKMFYSNRLNVTVASNLREAIEIAISIASLS